MCIILLTCKSMKTVFCKVSGKVTRSFEYSQCASNSLKIQDNKLFLLAKSMVSFLRLPKKETSRDGDLFDRDVIH